MAGHFRAAGDSHIVLAALDATQNDWTGDGFRNGFGPYDLQQFPTLVLFPASTAGKETPIVFPPGPRTVQTLTQFVAQHRLSAPPPPPPSPRVSSEQEL